MKFFGWGRKKDPPPITNLAHPKFKYSDAATWSAGSAVEHGRSDHLVGSLEDQHQNTPPRRVVELAQQAGPSKGLLGEALGTETWEETWLQETIRFVFSHEHEGLLAIGTFALDQLADSAITHPDNYHQSKPPPAITGPHNSRRNSVSSVQVVIREVRSSDDETDHISSMRSPIQLAAQSSYPVFGDHDAFSWGVIPLSRSSTATSGVTKDHHQPPCSTTSSAPNAPDQASGVNYALPTSTATKNFLADPTSTLTLAHDHQYNLSSDESNSNPPGLCGLFAARSRRTPKHGWKEKRKKGNSWRSLCTGRSSSGTSGSKVSPEKKLDPTPDHYARPKPQGPPCIANVVEDEVGVGERIKRRGHSFGKGWGCGAQNGKWIRTDSEFVVLEM